MAPAANPAKLESHCLHIVIHACRVISFQYEEIIPGKKLRNFNTDTPDFLNYNNELYPLAALEIQSMSAQIAGGAVPLLITKELDAQVADLIKAIREADTYKFLFILRAEEPLLKDMAEAFQAAYITEQTHDPAKDWIKNSPNAEAFQMGNLVD
jgi:hypothetical protein